MNIWNEQAVVKTYNKLHKLPLGAITAKGWLKDQLLRSKDGTGGHLDELEPDMIANPFIDYSAYKSRPGANDDATFSAGWSSEISGTYWTGLVQLAYTLNDPELIDKATTWVNGVLKHQEPDGYLGGYPENTDRMADYNAWGSAWCYRAMLSYYEATFRKEVLDAVYKGLLWFCENWKNHKTPYVGSVLIESMVIVYAYTGDMRLIQFSEDWLDWLEENSPWQNKISQYLSDELPYNAMHVVAYGEDMKHPGLVYCATGNETYLKATVNATRKALRKIVQLTGGPSSCGEYLSPIGSSNETEYCNFVTFSHSYSWLALITGQASWGDEIERVLFNGAQGARKKDERANAYMSAPNQLYADSTSTVYGVAFDMGAYAPCFHIACCPAQGVRVIPEFVRGMCMLNEQGELHLFCYGPASVKSSVMEFEMDTLYPFRDTVTLTIRKAENQSLHLRIPAWCKAPQVTVNGQSAQLALAENGFAKLLTALNTGDTVVVRFPMEITVQKVNDTDSGRRYPMCVQRGPLVYALPVPEKWTAYAGRPITPTPEGWNWYHVRADISNIPVTAMHRNQSPNELRYKAYSQAPWAKVMREDVRPEDITVEEIEPTGYVWENPPIKLHVPMYHAPLVYMTTGHKTHDVWNVPVQTEGDEQLCTMVPHGCTNLRITYIPRLEK